MTTPPPGWYQDPSGVSGPRFWDGIEWTDYPTPFVTPTALPPSSTPQLGSTPQPIGTIVSGPNHALHVVLSLLSCGLWLPIWLIVALDNKRRVQVIDSTGRITALPGQSNSKLWLVLIVALVIVVVLSVLI